MKVVMATMIVLVIVMVTITVEMVVLMVTKGVCNEFGGVGGDSDDDGSGICHGSSDGP
jgi:hypothetical protein